MSIKTESGTEILIDDTPLGPPLMIDTGPLAPPAKTLTINQIAAQLANSKSAQPTQADVVLTTKVTTVNFTDDNSPTKANSITASMPEGISLKHSPTLTKQLAKPSPGSAAGLQVITQYMCRYCGQQFDSTDQMQKHIQEHVEGKTPHQCSVCGKTYRTPSKLQRHVRVHSGERPYACSVCGRRFTRSDHVKQHMKVHFQVPVNVSPKDSNVCHLCTGMKFARRHALHAHLQQQHSLNQVFTCHRCGEAYETLEEMQTHKLSHDTILNSLKDNKTPYKIGVAKFSLGVNKPDTSMNKYDFINIKPKSETSTNGDTKTYIPIAPAMKAPPLYVPANMDNVSALSNKLIMEQMAKETADQNDLQKQYDNEVKQLNDDAHKFKVEQEELEKKIEEEKLKIAKAFTLKADTTSSNNNSTNSNDVVTPDDTASDSGLEVEGKETTHIVNGDGMAMFILPTLSQGNVKEEESDMETEDSEQNSSKDSSGINREGDDEKSDEDGKVNNSYLGNVSNSGSQTEVKISTKAEGYVKPCPRSKKPGFVPIAAKVTEATETKTVSSSEYPSLPLSHSPRSLLSTLNPRINELIKAKVEQNHTTQSSVPQTTFIITSPSVNQQLPKLTLIPSMLPNKLPQSNFQTILPTPSSSSVTLAAVAASVAGQSATKKIKLESPKLIKCEHCCIYFEDNAMSMLHNTLHSADPADPFTCRKCFKKLGNRLEFMAHLIWHLEPNMDI